MRNIISGEATLGANAQCQSMSLPVQRSLAKGRKGSSFRIVATADTGPLSEAKPKQSIQGPKHLIRDRFPMLKIGPVVWLRGRTIHSRRAEMSFMPTHLGSPSSMSKTLAA